ncbi:hypothetical protein D3C78_1064520 [compost metagenome]
MEERSARRWRVSSSDCWDGVTVVRDHDDPTTLLAVGLDILNHRGGDQCTRTALRTHQQDTVVLIHLGQGCVQQPTSVVRHVFDRRSEAHCCTEVSQTDLKVSSRIALDLVVRRTRRVTQDQDLLDPSFQHRSLRHPTDGVEQILVSSGQVRPWIVDGLRDVRVPRSTTLNVCRVSNQDLVLEQGGFHLPVLVQNVHLFEPGVERTGFLTLVCQ